MEFLKKGYGLVILLVTSRISITAIAFGALSQALFSFVVNAIPNRKLLNYFIREQIQDVLPSAVISAIMGGIVYVVGLVFPDTMLIFWVQILIGIIVYSVLTYIFRREEFIYILGLAKSIRKR
jgi:hypothetical protein